MIAIIGLIGYLLGCRRPTPEEIYAKEFQQVAPDDEFLLAGNDSTSVNINQASQNEYFHNNSYFPHDTSSSIGQTRIGQSNEDMV